MISLGHDDVAIGRFCPLVWLGRAAAGESPFVSCIALEPVWHHRLSKNLAQILFVTVYEDECVHI